GSSSSVGVISGIPSAISSLCSVCSSTSSSTASSFPALQPNAKSSTTTNINHSAFRFIIFSLLHCIHFHYTPPCKWEKDFSCMRFILVDKIYDKSLHFVIDFLFFYIALKYPKKVSISKKLPLMVFSLSYFFIL